jgi:hypothetical protein
MAIVYQVFSNGGTGGPVDYSTVIATVSGTSYTTGTLMAPGDYRFAVRAQDTVTGLVESNTQASVRIVLDANGNLVAPAPGAPLAVKARASMGGGCLVSWSYFAAGQAATPANFLVYLTAGGTPALTTPVATIAYQSGVVAYSCQLSGLADATVYTVSVAAQSASGTVGPATSATVVGDATPPDDVDSLTATAIP